MAFDSAELIKNAINSINDNLYVTTLTYTVSTGEQKDEIDSNEIKNGMSFKTAKTRTETIRTAASDTIKYDLLGKIASATLKGIRPEKFAFYKQNPEDFINKASKLINEQKASIIVERVSYYQINGTFDSSIFAESKATGEFKNAFKATKHIRDYVFVDGINKDSSTERRFAEDLDRADEVCVYAETKGSLDSLQLRGVESAKIDCARKLFNKMSSSKVRYEYVTSYSDLLDKMNGLA